MAEEENNVELMSPMRLVSYRDDENGNQIFQWVIGEYENKQLTHWESIVDGSSAITQDVSVVELIHSMLFTVTVNTTAGNSVLTISDAPELTNGGECVRGGDLEMFDVTSDVYNLNTLKIYKNGTLLTKNSDVYFVETNKIRLVNRLQVGDTILIDYQVGN